MPWDILEMKREGKIFTGDLNLRYPKLFQLNSKILNPNILKYIILTFHLNLKFKKNPDKFGLILDFLTFKGFIRLFYQSRIPNLQIFYTNIYHDFFFTAQTEKTSWKKIIKKGWWKHLMNLLFLTAQKLSGFKCHTYRWPVLI